MKTTFVIPGPETVIWWGVNVPLLAAVLGIVGVLVGHLMAPVIGTPLPLHKQLYVVFGGLLMAITIAMAVGQKPWLVLAWGFGIGFSGITIFRTIGAQTREGMKTLGEIVVERLKHIGAGDADDGATDK